jgi:hypothetical protein
MPHSIGRTRHPSLVSPPLIRHCGWVNCGWVSSRISMRMQAHPSRRADRLLRVSWKTGAFAATYAPIGAAGIGPGLPALRRVSELSTPGRPLTVAQRLVPNGNRIEGHFSDESYSRFQMHISNGMSSPTIKAHATRESISGSSLVEPLDIYDAHFEGDSHDYRTSVWTAHSPPVNGADSA